MARIPLIALTSWHTWSLSSKTVNSVVCALLRKNYYSIKLQRHWESFISPSCKGTVSSLQTLLWAVWCTDLKPTLYNTHSLTPDSQPLGLFPLMQNQTTGLWTMLTQAFIHCICYNPSKGKVTRCNSTMGPRASMIVIMSSRAHLVCKMIFHTLFYVNLSIILVGFYRQEKQRWNQKAQVTCPSVHSEAELAFEQNFLTPNPAILDRTVLKKVA